MALPQRTFHLLAALAVRPLHGYGLISEVDTLSEGRVRMSVGTLYGALDRLAEAGLVEVDREVVVDGRLRRYYRLTDAGARQLADETEVMRRDVAAATERLRVRATRPGLAT